LRKCIDHVILLITAQLYETVCWIIYFCVPTKWLLDNTASHIKLNRDQTGSIPLPWRRDKWQSHLHGNEMEIVRIFSTVVIMV